MLVHLRVLNLGVLADAAIDPSPGLTVITGETGAGKTLLLDGLRLVMGEQADAKAVGPSDASARVDGLFLDGDGFELGVSRVVPAEGRSRAHLEGAIVSAAVLGDRIRPLVEVVGQHDQLSIVRASHVLEFIDGALDDGGLAAKQAYLGAWQQLQDALERQTRLGGDQVELARELDLARYQSDEIAAARLTPSLDEEMETAVSRLRNVEEIREHLVETSRLADVISESVGEMVARLRKAAGLDPSLATIAGEAETLSESVGEVAHTARDAAEGLEADPGRLVEMEQMLNSIGDLKRKYGRTLDEVIAYGDQATSRVTELETLLADAGQIESLVAEARSLVTASAGALTARRLVAADRIAAEMQRHLGDLALNNARVEVGISEVGPGPGGADRAELRFASDQRLELRPVAEGASGGELSRLVLALRLATRTEATSTLVFDEIDTGIGGKTALAMGQKLAQLAVGQQVLCVTHLPQVAAFADTHYVVERGEDGLATARPVGGDERITEITRMLAGQPESTAGREAAAELLEMARAKPTLG